MSARQAAGSKNYYVFHRLALCQYRERSRGPRAGSPREVVDATGSRSTLESHMIPSLPLRVLTRAGTPRQVLKRFG